MAKFGWVAVFSMVLGCSSATTSDPLESGGTESGGDAGSSGESTVALGGSGGSSSSSLAGSSMVSVGGQMLPPLTGASGHAAGGTRGSSVGGATQTAAPSGGTAAAGGATSVGGASVNGGSGAISTAAECLFSWKETDGTTTWTNSVPCHTYGYNGITGLRHCDDSGACVSCQWGFMDCDGDGFCESGSNKPATCGGCGITCPSGLPKCTKTDQLSLWGYTCTEN